MTVPMLNPDGVINGNYRCNLAGFDLNRSFFAAEECWTETHLNIRECFPYMRRLRKCAHPYELLVVLKSV